MDDSISVSQMGRMGPLHYAALRSFTEVVAVFLEAGVEVDSTWRGRTALHYAAGLTSKYSGLVEDEISNALATRHEATTRALIEAGASVNVATEGSHLTPLHFAAASGMYQVCRLLLAAGASVDLLLVGIGTSGIRRWPTHIAGLRGTELLLSVSAALGVSFRFSFAPAPRFL